MDLKSYILQQLMAVENVKTDKIDFEVNLDETGRVKSRPTGNVVRFTVAGPIKASVTTSIQPETAEQ